MCAQGQPPNAPREDLAASREKRALRAGARWGNGVFLFNRHPHLSHLVDKEAALRALETDAHPRSSRRFKCGGTGELHCVAQSGVESQSVPPRSAWSCGTPLVRGSMVGVCTLSCESCPTRCSFAAKESINQEAEEVDTPVLVAGISRMNRPLDCRNASERKTARKNWLIID